MQVQRLIRVFSMRRGGQHVFIDWLLEQCPGHAVFLNDVAPDTDLGARLAAFGEFDSAALDGLPAFACADTPSTLIVNYEDWPLQASMLDPAGVTGVAAQRIDNLVLLRSPLNLFASRYFFWSRMPPDAPRWRWDDTALWMNHAAVCRDTEQGAGRPVLFDRWISDAAVRRQLAAELGLQYSDDSLGRLSHVGSQFDSDIDGSYSERVTSRWRYAADVPAFRQLFSGELVQLSQQLFGDAAAFSAMQAAAESPAPPAQEVMQLVQQGELARARRRAIRLCHEQPQLQHLNLLAGVFAQEKNFQDVIACCRRMLQLDPGSARTRYNLALAYQELGRFDEARELYEQLRAGGEQGAAIAINLANVYMHQAQHERADELLKSVEPQAGGSMEYLNTCALLRMEQQRDDEAVVLLQQAVETAPGAVGVRLNLGRALAKAGRSGEALRQLDVLAGPGTVHSAELLLARAFVLRHAGDYEQAAQVLQSALERGDAGLELFTELGLVYRELDRYEAAIDALRRALAYRHAYEKTLSNMAAVATLAGDYDAAVEYCEQALVQNPDHAEAHWNLAYACLYRGDLERGWREYEWRFEAGISRRLRYEGLEPWQGQPLQGRSILLYTEQGFGDAIHFSRYCRELQQLGAEVVIACKPLIGGLLRHAEGVARTLPPDAVDSGCELYAPLLSLPYLLGSRSIARMPAYITPDFSRVSADLYAALDTGARLKVAVAWSGNPAYPENERRSFDVSRLAAIAAIDGVQLFSIQKGAPVRDLYEAGLEGSIVDLDAVNDSFTDTACIMSQVDLVVTVDTVFAHIGGATGCPTCVLLSHGAEWRWHDDDADSRWYRSLSIIRQRQPRGWDDVFERLAARLGEML